MSINLSRFRADIGTSLLNQGIDPESPLYSHGRYAYDWEHGTDLMPCEPGSYEKFLEDFFHRDPGSHEQADNVMIVVGGIGTGKSTAIRRALHRAGGMARTCSRAGTDARACIHKPRILEFDFRTDEDRVADGDSDVDAEKQRFWNHVASELEARPGNELPVAAEVTSFWNWCLGEKRLLDLSPILHQELGVQKHAIRAAVTNDESLWPRAQHVRSLVIAREKLIRSFSHQDLVWYNAYLLRYQIDTSLIPCHCAYLFLDNIDQLHPKVQRLAAETAITLSEVLRSRTIIAIRPLTWKRSVHGYTLIRTEKHRSPAIFDVLRKRVNSFIENNGLAKPEADALRSLVTIMSGKGRDPLVGTLLDATSGYSVRFALRNFSNMFDSPTLRSLPDTSTAFHEMRVSDLARAFFCGERSQIIPHAFENLYAVRGDMRTEHWLIKPRLLDILCRSLQGTSRINELADILRRFGYSDNLLLTAINELLIRTRPLIWSEEDMHCNDLGSPAQVTVTPIGWRYYRDLFGEVYYDEVCHPVDAFAVTGLRAVYEFHLQLTEQDLREAAAAKGKYGAVFYFSHYPDDMPGLTVLHARRVIRAILNRIRIRDTDVYDVKRDEWVAKRFREILGVVQTDRNLP